jgi:signal peptidase I
VIHAPDDYDVEYIKRVVGLPGDKLLFKNNSVYLNGEKLNEPYLVNVPTPVWGGAAFAKENQEITIPNTDLFVMGDNRPKSKDSREFGTIPISSVIGQVFYRYFPANKMGVIANPWPNPDQRLQKKITFLYFDKSSSILIKA